VRNDLHLAQWFADADGVIRKNFIHRRCGLSHRIEVEDALVLLGFLFVFNLNTRDIYLYRLLARRYTAKGTPGSSMSSPGDTLSA
jgi:hypothetical protein